MRLEARRRAPVEAVEALEVVEQGVLPEEARRRELEAELEVPLVVLRRLVPLVPLLPVPVPLRREVPVPDLPLELFLRPPLTLSMPSRSSHTSPTVPCTSNLPFLTTPYTILPQLDTAWMVVSSLSKAFIPPHAPSLFLREGAPLRRLRVLALDRVPEDLEPVDRLPVDLVPVVRLLDEEEEALPRRVDELASSAPAPPTQSTSAAAAPPRMTCSLLSCVRRDRSCGAIFCKVLT